MTPTIPPVLPHPGPIHYGSLRLPSRYLISPLAGYTNLSFRRVCRELGGEELRTSGATNAVALSTLMPNVQISSGSSGSTDISIRGIVSTNTTEVGDPAAGFHVDGVYFGRPQSSGANFFDLERVEVLRGPQGTL